MNPKSDKLIIKYVGVEAPVYYTIGAAGCDIIANESVEIEPWKQKTVSTGLFLDIPSGYECQIRSRSGLVGKKGIFVLNGIGTIDSDYKGELKVILANFSDTSYNVEKGNRIAQLVFSPIIQAAFEKVDELTTSDRGTSGFGSTGV